MGHFATDDEVATTSLAKRESSIGVNVDIDVVKAIEDIASAIAAAQDRGARNKAAVYSAEYAGRGLYSVMAFDLQQDFTWNTPPNPATTAFTTYQNEGKTFGLWAFQGEADFRNNGDGGWINWGFYGNIDRKDKNIFFHALK